jgi:broad specificity phosphatase PhoE
MKTLYLLRHGESESNTGAFRARAESPLTQLGILQSHAAAHRCAPHALDVVVCGESARAEHTARIIAAHSKAPLIVSSLFSERRKPSILDGLAKSDPLSRQVDVEIRTNFHLPGYRHSDEENFDDLKERLSAAFSYLTNLRGSSVLVVTHGIVLRLLVAHILFGKAATAEVFEVFHRGLRMHNSGLTVIQEAADLTEEGASSKWQLWSWNDSAHARDLFQSMLPNDTIDEEIASHKFTMGDRNVRVDSSLSGKVPAADQGALVHD